jgi:hypothetical protein
MIKSADKIYDPPKNDVLIAFAEAVDTWSGVEWHLMLLFNTLMKSGDINLTATVFTSITGFRNQLDMIEGAARVSLQNHADALKAVKKIIDRARRLGGKRNSLIHGRWKEMDCYEDDAYTHTVIHRDYPTDNPFGHTPSNLKEEQPLIGKFRFYLSDLKRTEQEFKTLATDISFLQADILPFVLPAPR